jgi:hypothetical protein
MSQSMISTNIVVWYAWAVAMGDTVVGLTGSYQPTKAINDLLSQTKKLDFDEQMSVLCTIAGEMGYTDVKPIATQVETGKTPSLQLAMAQMRLDKQSPPQLTLITYETAN